VRKPHRAEALLRQHLKQRPTRVATACWQVAVRLAQWGCGETARALPRLAPGFTPARYAAIVLHRLGRPAEARRRPGLTRIEKSGLSQPDGDPRLLGGFDQALEVYSGVPRVSPPAQGLDELWPCPEGRRRQQDSVAAYRRSIGMAPGLGEAWWSLANLKTFRFSPAEVDAMRSQLERAELTDEDRLHFHFTLGKALEDAGDFAGSFAHYAEGNRLRRAAAAYDAEETSAHVRRSKALFSRAFFAERAGSGAGAPDPIFIVGCHGGPTLLEQILRAIPPSRHDGALPT
jgi:hypothetical protein